MFWLTSISFALGCIFTPLIWMYVCFIYPYTKKFKDRGEIKRPLDSQYYCLEVILRKIFSLDGSILLCITLFCSWVRARKHVE